MRVQLLYFAVIREIVGKSEETIDLPADVRTVHDLRRWIVDRTPALSGNLPQVRFAVDEAFESDAFEIHAGATIALIPPVAGG